MADINRTFAESFRLRTTGARYWPTLRPLCTRQHPSIQIQGPPPCKRMRALRARFELVPVERPVTLCYLLVNQQIAVGG